MELDIGDLDISVICDFERGGVTLQQEIEIPFSKIELIVQCSGSANQAQLDQLALEVAKYCPLSKLFRNAGTIINETWRAKNN